MRVYQNAAPLAEWEIAYDAPGLEAVRFDAKNGIIYVLCMDALQDVYILSYDTGMRFAFRTR